PNDVAGVIQRECPAIETTGQSPKVLDRAARSPQDSAACTAARRPADNFTHVVDGDGFALEVAGQDAEVLNNPASPHHRSGSGRTTGRAGHVAALVDREGATVITSGQDAEVSDRSVPGPRHSADTVVATRETGHYSGLIDSVSGAPRISRKRA